jgi:dolichyl-phosphate-mannose--protein O-mannosyl transferase
MNWFGRFFVGFLLISIIDKLYYIANDVLNTTMTFIVSTMFILFVFFGGRMK